MFRGMKDAAIAQLIRAWVNDKFAEFGEVTELSVDSSVQRLSMKAMLKGERDMVSASIERYEIEREAGESYIVLKQFSSSRAWLTQLLQKLFGGKRYKLPGAVSALL
jgi:hypothetical protein